MAWGFKRQPESDHLMVIDIGTSYVKAVLFSVKDNQVEVITSASRSHEPGSMKGAMPANLHDVIQSLKETVEALWAEGGRVSRQTIFGVNGQLVEGVTTTVHYDRAHPESPLEHSELKNIIYKIQQRAYEKLRTSLKEKFMDDHPGIELIHATIVDMQLDGYTIANPIGFQGKRLTLTIFSAYVPLVYTSILQNIAKELGLNIASIAALPYGLSKFFVNALDDDDAKEKLNAILLDIGGTSTDVIVVKNGSVEGIQSFAFGGDSFTLQVQEILGQKPDIAEETKIKYVEGRLDKRTTARLEERFLETARIWLEGVRVSLAEFPDLKLLPYKIYLTGGSAPLPELRRVLLTKAWANELPFVKKPSPAILKSDDLWGITNLEELDLEPQDIPTMCLTKLSLELTPENDIATQTLQSIVRSMKE